MAGHIVTQMMMHQSRPAPINAAERNRHGDRPRMEGEGSPKGSDLAQLRLHLDHTRQSPAAFERSAESPTEPVSPGTHTMQDHTDPFVPHAHAHQSAEDIGDHNQASSPRPWQQGMSHEPSSTNAAAGVQTQPSQQAPGSSTKHPENGPQPPNKGPYSPECSDVLVDAIHSVTLPEVKRPRYLMQTALEAEMKRRGALDHSPGEIVGYIIFVIMMTLTNLWGVNNQHIYFFSSSIKTVLQTTEIPEYFVANTAKPLTDLVTLTDVHYWLQGVFYPLVYRGGTYDGEYTDGWLFESSVIVGAPRVTQLRVKPQRCERVEAIELPESDEDRQCYPAYFSSRLDFDNPAGTDGVWPAKRVEAEPLCVSHVTGSYYTTPGYPVVLPRTEPRNCSATYATYPVPAGCPAAEALNSLQTKEYIDSATRAVFIDMNIYHPVLDRIQVVRVALEIMVGGQVVASVLNGSFQPYLYYNSVTYTVLALEIMVVLQAAFYLCIQMKTALRKRAAGRLKAYLMEPFTAVHIFNLLLFFVTWGITIWTTAKMPNTLDVASPHHIPLRPVMVYRTLAKSLNSFNIFLTWFKVFKYLAFVDLFAQVAETISTAQKQLAGFVFLIFIVLLGSSCAFLLAFSTEIKGFRTLGESMFSLLKALLIDFDLDELRRAHNWLGPLFFGVFIMMALFILLNMFIAILSDAYSEARSRIYARKQARRAGIGLYDHKSLTQLWRDWFLHKFSLLPGLGRLSPHSRVEPDNPDSALKRAQTRAEGFMHDLNTMRKYQS